MPHHPHIYGDPDSPLDALFFMAETRMDGLMEGLDRVKQTEFAPAGWFVQVAAPYVGQLLARHPHLEAPRPSDLTDAGSGINGLTERYALVWALMDRVMHNAVWSLAISSDGGWTTSDAGCVMLPGRGSGSLLVPLTPEVAIFLASGTPTYRFGAPSVRIKSYAWSLEDQSLVNDLIALTAPREVYAPTPEPIGRALDMWAQRAQPRTDSRGLSASLMTTLGPQHGPLSLLAGSWVDPGLARARFFASTHQFACNCSEQVAKMDPDQGAEWLAEMHTACQRGRDSLRLPASAPAYEDMAGITVSKDGQIILTADRRGLRTLQPDPPWPRLDPVTFLVTP